MIKFLDLYAQYLSIQDEIDAAIAQTIQQSTFIGGSALTQFETRFASYQHARHCVGVANGTDAIEIALEALKLPKGAEVIVPANSFIASSEAVTRAGHRVVFADVDPQTYTLDPADVKRRIGPRTKAFLAVHLYGHPCDMDGLVELGDEYNIKIIEDCAQAHGAEYKGRRVGSIGDIGTFSFFPGKNLGAYGDAGAITTNNEALAIRSRMIANHGRIDKYNHAFEGRNSRLDGLQAAILNAKLNHLDAWTARRNVVAARYIDGLRGVQGVIIPTVRSEVRHAFHLFVIRSPRRDELAGHLSTASIQTGIHYPIALPKLPAYAYLGQHDEVMVATTQDRELLSLPMGEHLTDADVDAVIQAVCAFSIELHA